MYRNGYQQDAGIFKKNQLLCYTCYAGLHEAVMPIFEESLVGYVMIGQFRLGDEFKPKDIVFDNLSNTQIQLLKKEFYKIPLFKEKELNDILKLFNILMDFIISHRLVVIKHLDSVQTIIEYINTNITENFTLDKASELTHRSKSSISHLFKEQTGKSLIQYQIDKKLEYAENLLINEPELSIKNISFRLGYQDQLYFSKIFRLKYGLSPLKYRKKHSK